MATWEDAQGRRYLAMSMLGPVGKERAALQVHQWPSQGRQRHDVRGSHGHRLRANRGWLRCGSPESSMHPTFRSSRTAWCMRFNPGRIPQRAAWLVRAEASAGRGAAGPQRPTRHHARPTRFCLRSTRRTERNCSRRNSIASIIFPATPLLPAARLHRDVGREAFCVRPEELDTLIAT